MRGTPLPDTRRVRWVFFGAWAVAGALLVAALVVTAGHPVAAGSSSTLSFIGRPVPVNTTFSFIFSQTMVLYLLNLTGTAPTQNVTLTVWGNWTATADTSTSVSINGGTPACPYPWGCYGSSGSKSGTLGLSVTISTDPAEHFFAHQLTIGLVFWAVTTDTVTVSSPIYVAVSG